MKDVHEQNLPNTRDPFHTGVDILRPRLDENEEDIAAITSCVSLRKQKHG